MKRIILILVVMFMLVVGVEARNAETDKYLDGAIAEATAKFPYRIDSTTIFTGVNREDNIVYFEYQLFGVAQIDGESYDIDAYFKSPMNRVVFIQVARENLVRLGCVDANSRFIIDKDYIIRKVFYNRNDKFLFYLELDKHMCRNK